MTESFDSVSPSCTGVHRPRAARACVAGIFTAALASSLALAAFPAFGMVTTTGCANIDVSCTLAELVGGATIQVDDKLFSSWQIEIDPGTVNFGLVDVEGIPGVAPGLRFLGNGELVAIDTDFMDLRFGFILEVLDPLQRTVEAQLTLTSTNVSGSGQIKLDEAVFELPFQRLGVASTEVDPTFATSKLADSVAYAPRTRLFIEKEIFLEGLAPGDFSELDEFEQVYIPAPEPGQLALLLAGASYLPLLTRLRARRQRRGACASQAQQAEREPSREETLRCD